MSEKKKKILVIDDSNTNVVLLEALLISKGFDIETALSVQEAIPIIEKTPPELILLDLLMPHTSGYQFLEELKKNDRFKRIPVIIVSAVTGKENKMKTMNLGAIDYIEKPIDIHTLVAKVENALN